MLRMKLEDSASRKVEREGVPNARCQYATNLACGRNWCWKRHRLARDSRAEKSKGLRKSDRSIGRIAWVVGKRDDGLLSSDSGSAMVFSSSDSQS